MNLGNDKALWFLFAVPSVLLPVYIWCFWQKTRALRVLASSEMLKKINNAVSLKKQIFKALLLLAAFVSIVVALTEPKWNPQVQKIKRQGRDVCILLDTSRSMLAEDIKPNRLERSKIAITDLLETLAGDRIAIVGNSVVKCPLTQDYAFVRMALADISAESTSRGGTMVGDAIRKAAEEVFDKKSREFKDIILITDGEEHEGYESFPVQAAEKAAGEGIRIIAIGLGDENEGSRIPITGPNGEKTFLKYKGEEVWSKLGGDLLRNIVYVTDGGKYLSVEPGTTLDLGQIYENLIASAQKRELESTTMLKYDEKFQIFVALGLVLLICEVLISERKKI
jgi:Ca-activated chloride channel family protein